VKNLVLKLLASALLTLNGGQLVYAQSAPPAPQRSQTADFEADELNYDSQADVVTASGNVRMVLEDGNRLSADRITWNRKSGEVLGEGNIIVSNANGDRAFGDSVVISDSLRDGIVKNLLIVLKDGGRLVAKNGERAGDISRLDLAAFTPCRVENDMGCPKEPVWKITAVKITHDPANNRISYKDARLEIFGVTILALPGLSHPADARGASGILIPDVQYTRTNGLELSVPYYLLIDRNRDFTVTPHVYSKVAPAAEFKYRALTGKGAYQIGGFLTYGSRVEALLPNGLKKEAVRGYLESSGKFQLDPRWSISGATRLTTDRTFLRRYDISRDDRLRNTINIERVTRSSYFSLAGWAFQTLRVGDPQGQMPIVLPVMDYRKRISDPWIGGVAEFQLNSLALARTDGQDTQRAFAGARWDLRRIGAGGQELVLTGYARADVYHSTHWPASWRNAADNTAHSDSCFAEYQQFVGAK
jgi:LPS-assembly protein